MASMLRRKRQRHPLLVAIRRANALSLGQLARELGYSKAYVGAVEIGDKRPSQPFMEAVLARYRGRMGRGITVMEVMARTPWCPVCLGTGRRRGSGRGKR